MAVVSFPLQFGGAAGTLEKLGDLKSKGILTQEEFDTKKAELLKKLV